MITANTESALLARTYPTLKSGISLHRTPRDGVLFRQNHCRVKASDGRAFKLNVPQMEMLNNGGTEILASCDGTKTVDELIDGFCSRFGMPRETSYPALLKFFNGALERGHIEVKETPCSDPPRVTGSSEFDLPIVATFELTTQCNLFCKHCYRESDSQKVSMLPTDRLLKIMTELSEKGTRMVELTGGEPMMHPDFLPIARHAVKCFEAIALLTNGTIGKEEYSQFIIDNREKFVLGVSIDSPEPEFHDGFRGMKGSHAKASAFVRRMAGAAVFVRVAMSVVPENASDIERTLQYSKELGALGFAYNPVLPIGRGANVSWEGIPRDRIKELHDIELSLIKNHRDTLSVVGTEQLDFMKRWGNCGAGSRAVAIDPMGYLRVCQMSDAVAFRLGNIGEQDIEEIMGGDRARLIRNLQPPTPETCGACRHEPLCRHCFVRGYNTYVTKNPGCFWAAKNGIPLPEDVDEVRHGCSIWASKC